MASVRHPGFVLDIYILGGLYHCAKFGYNRCISFNNMSASLFGALGRKTLTHAPKIQQQKPKIYFPKISPSKGDRREEKGRMGREREGVCGRGGREANEEGRGGAKERRRNQKGEKGRGRDGKKEGGRMKGEWEGEGKGERERCLGIVRHCFFS